MKRYKYFIAILAYTIISSFGDLVFYPVMLLQANTYENSELYVSLVVFFEQLPKFIGIVLFAVSERVLKKRYLALGTLISRTLIFLLVATLITSTSGIVFVFVIILLFLSDLLGKIDDPIEIGYLMHSLENEDDQIRGMSFKSISEKVIEISSYLIGGLLIVIYSFGVISLINALTFFITALIFITIIKWMKGIDDNVYDESKKNQPLFTLAIDNLKSIIKIRGLRNIVIGIGSVNILLVACSYFTANILLEREYFFNSDLVINVVLVIQGVSLLLGFATTGILGSKVKFQSLVKISSIIGILLLISLFFDVSYITMVLISICTFVAGMTMPTMFTEVMKHISQEQIGIYGATLNYLMVVATPIYSGILILLVFVFPFEATIVFTIILVILPLFLNFNIKQSH